MMIDAALSGLSAELEVEAPKPPDAIGISFTLPLDERPITGVKRYHVHLCQDLQGAIANWGRDMWEAVARDNDTTPEAVKERFRIWVFEGKRVIPFGDPCEGFSYIDGCPGHAIADEPPGGNHG